MTFTSIFSLFVALIILAATPGPGVFTVVARSMAGGFLSGLATVLGIVFGDYIFIVLSVCGLAALSSAMGGFFAFIKYAGAMYLIFLGMKLLLAKSNSVEIKPASKQSLSSNFLAGLVTTLSNPKAILFYVSFFPAFVDVQQVASFQVFQLLLVATVAVGFVMAGYAYTASKASGFFKNSDASKKLNVAAGSIMIGSGALLGVRS